MNADLVRTRPWPVVLLTALGAWLAAVPLIGVVGLLLGDSVRDGAGAYLVGALVLAGAVVVLRARGLPLFVEQLAVPALLVGGGSIALGAFRDLPDGVASALMGALALGVAAAVPLAWLRAPLGAAAATFAAIALMPRLGLGPAAAPGAWLAWHAVFGAWALAAFAGRRLDTAVLDGAAAAVLLALAWWSGPSLLGGATGLPLQGAAPVQAALHATSAALGLAALVRLARHWPSLRRARWAVAAVVPVLLSALLPALGAVLWMLAAFALARRGRMASAAALAAAWIVGSFYYQLDWPLAQKALVLAAGGALLGALAWRATPRVANAAALSASPGWPGIVLTVGAVLAVVNTGIWQKERLIAHGEPVFVALAPVDPRSLVQGDYMQLNFALPAVDAAPAGAARPKVVARRDARGIATVHRLDDGRPLADGELRIALTPKDGGWVLVSDAWFFAEGEAERWAQARYGEFRVGPDGQALLVGLRGVDLAAL